MVKIIMLPKNHRINKIMFKEAFKAGKSVFSEKISMKIAFIPDSKENIRFAFVVSAKTAKKAVDRNKLKRRARYIVAKILPLAQKSPLASGRGLAIIIFFKKGSEKLSFQELEKEISALFRKAKILNN